MGALTVKLEGEGLTEMAELTDAGCVAFSQGRRAAADTQVLWRALQYAATFGYAVWLRAEDAISRGAAWPTRARWHAPRAAGIPAFAETIALGTLLSSCASPARACTCAGCHRGRGGDGPQGQAARPAGHVRRGRPSSAPLGDRTSATSTRNAAWCRRSRASAIATRLRAGWPRARSTAVCSDSPPVDDDAKHLPFGEAEPGATGLELLLPLTLKWGEAQGLGLAATLARITSEPARILGVPSGRLTPGAPADLAIFDPAARLRIAPETLKSQGKNTPFLGCELAGRVRYTIVAGQVVYES